MHARLLLVALLLGAFGAAVVRSQSEVIFGQSAPFSGGAWEPGHRFNAGLLAAFHEANTAGGVNGRQVKLVSYDDQYDTAQIPGNVEKLLNYPNMFVFVGFMGSPTTTVALPLLAAAKMPVVGPLTGSAVFRKTFNPWTINVRAGYDDEALTMLRLFVTEKRFRRVSVIYQDDAFGAPAKDAILAAMKNMNLQITAVHSYARADIPQYDYAAYAAEVWSHRPQGVILYTVEGFSNPFLTEMYKIMTYKVLFVTGSWLGDGNLNHLKRNNLDPTNFYMTQVMPHPESDLEITRRYRAALVAHEGIPNPQRDFLSVEGYVVGRMVVEALRRTPTLDKAAFLQAVYETKMFGFDELLAGPFSNDCQYDPGTADGRSSMCFCNQGLRVVETTVLTANYEYASAGVPKVQYPITECFAPLDVVSRPLLLSALTPADPTAELLAARALLEVGLTLHDTTKVQIEATPVARSPANATVAAMVALGENVLLMGGLAMMETADQDSYPIFPLLSELPRLSGTSFRRATIHLMPTLEQELHVAAHDIESSGNTGAIHLLAHQDIAPSNEGTLETLMSWSLETYGRTLASTARFVDAASLSQLLNGIGGNANVIVVGMKTAEHMTALTTYLTAQPTVTAHVCFNDVALHWNQLIQTPNATLARVLFATSLPHWTNPASGDFQFKYAAAATRAGHGATMAHPLNAMGYLMSRIVQFLVTRANGDASPAAILRELYRTSVVAFDEVTLGPFVQESCGEGEDCRCSRGVRSATVFSVSSILHKTTENRPSERFGRCGVSYRLNVVAASSDNAGIIAVAVVVPLVVILGIVGAVVARKVARDAKVKCAPKSGSGFCTMFVALKRETFLWEFHTQETMERVMDTYRTVVERHVKGHACYLVRQVGGAFLIAAQEPSDILACAAAVSTDLQGNHWNIDYEAADQHRRESKFARKQTIMTGVNSDVSSICSGNSTASTMRKKYSMKNHDQVSPSFSIGVHYGRGRVQYNSEVHAYEYSGPAVDGAGMACDRAQGDQILVTEFVDSAGTTKFAPCLDEFSTMNVQEKDVKLLQMTPPGTTKRTFEEKTDDANVDSITAALEQQSAGVTAKKVVVLSVFLNNLEEMAAKLSRDAFAREYQTKLEDIHSIVAMEKGFVHSIVGPRLIVTFNAANPTPQAPKRAYNVYRALWEVEEGHLSAGIATDTSLVGAFTVKNQKHNALISRVADLASALQRRCDKFTDTTILITSILAEDFAHFADTEFVGVARKVNGAKPVGIMAVHHRTASADDDEWMYTLEKEDTGKFNAVNDLYKKLLGGDMDLGSAYGGVPADKQDTQGYKVLGSILQFLKTSGHTGDALLAYADTQEVLV